ncbi:NADH-quinone oxidoreductase subunit J [Roseisolibacter sp. H3M3-2]|uniref:NADH-quinone oxidoreductase subunit J family protein n=1 Tax=Roseisolibacter sp. H3M3-2 TaxID=3031323 RepID=UPI0023DCB061|nr:NADH-quinone oxidoreductase subunit J [Roseisolibacter sp. H3M3-2]MDF1501466.1 NADH-quinone oxidoreductase subunit J [Roseisolibacter sp. H3M3-2]
MSLLYQVHFYLFGIIAVASALFFVTRKNPVAAALWLVNTMFALAALYVMLDAQFVGAIQVLVYAGAIMVVFLFVVMLLNLGQTDAPDFRTPGVRLGAAAVAVVMLAELLVLSRAGRIPEVAPSATPQTNVVAPVAELLFTEHLLAFEITSVLLLVAVVGAVVLAKRQRRA